ncbi:MAG: DNA cytosine methyltransferase [Planctomycetota bacterium]
MPTAKKTAISLFTSGGVGDLAIRDSGFDILVSNELLEDRHAVFEFNFPEATAITGDIWARLDAIEAATTSKLQGAELTLLYATPPCQGMSKNGRGKLLNAIRAGLKPRLDERNRLIIPTMELARRLKPEIVLLENVPEMADTLIVGVDGEPVQILDFVRSQLGSEYRGVAEVVEFADYGVPQCRQRLITIFTRNSTLLRCLDDCGSLLPPPTHSRDASYGTKPWATVRDVIAGLPPLDAGSANTAKSGIPFHRVPLLDSMKYWWVSNTPPERGAFDNQCIECGYDRNPTHVARHDSEGINRASKDTPLYCLRCGAMLPRPSTEVGGKRLLMRGFTSAYKRMQFDKPASALTRNLSYACSDNKLHPNQHRVLSLYEAFRIHTLDQFDYRWKRSDRRRLSEKTIREIVGESVPPLGLKRIVEHVVQVYEGREERARFAALGPLFAGQCVGI